MFTSFVSLTDLFCSQVQFDIRKIIKKKKKCFETILAQNCENIMIM